MINYYYQRKQIRDAYAVIQEMQDHQIPLQTFIDNAILQDISRVMNVRFDDRRTAQESKWESKGNEPQEADEEIVEGGMDEEEEVYSIPITQQNRYGK